ncbi:MAG: hypothetical protein PHF51_03510 [Candidatus ainarchaeum sp.]|nr:hypothetical protein [Candidatus ainarchaeum sp.]
MHRSAAQRPPAEWAAEPRPGGGGQRVSPETVAKSCEFQRFFHTPRTRKAFARAVEEKVIPKILEDIPKILANGWADSVSKEDLYHCHILFPHSASASANIWSRRGFVKAERPEIMLLYHSREEAKLLPSSKNRSILSPLNSHELRADGKYAVLHGPDIGCWNAGYVFFAKTRAELENPLLDRKFDRVCERGGYVFGISVT